MSDSFMVQRGLTILSPGNTYPIWMVTDYPGNKKEVIIKFLNGLIIQKMSCDEKWRVTFSTNNYIKINMEYTMEEVLYIINDLEKVSLIKDIKILTGLNKEEFFESLTNKEIIDFIIFNIDFFNGE